MKKVYNIEFTKDFKGFKKGQKTTKFSKDLSWMLVNTLKVAKYYVEKVKLKKNK
jgi:hypothetical protein